MMDTERWPTDTADRARPGDPGRRAGERRPNASGRPRSSSSASRIIEALRTVYDPEIPVNIYELGLIYKIDVEDDNRVLLDMTLTSPNCPVAETLPGEVEHKVGRGRGRDRLRGQDRLGPALESLDDDRGGPARAGDDLLRRQCAALT